MFYPEYPIPVSWRYNDSLETLFFFYTATKELLSDQSPDSYALPLHNTLSLINEMDEMFRWLEEFNMVVDYYSSYMPPIIDEFIQKTVDDDIFKKILGGRLDSIRTGFKEAKEDYRFFEKWIGIVEQACSPYKYVEIHKKEIEILVTKNSKKRTELLFLIKNYYISLLFFGYSREFLYKSTKNFFDNKDNEICSSEQISLFLELFDLKSKDFEFLALINASSVEYVSDIHKKDFYDFDELKKEEIENLKDKIDTKGFFNEYAARVSSARPHDKIKVVHFHSNAMDPYRAMEGFIARLDALQMFRVYFIHSYSAIQVYSFLLKVQDNKYLKIMLPRKLQKRPHVEKSLASIRMQNIIYKNKMSSPVRYSIVRAINMHAEAISLRSHAMIVRSLWTALEALFLDPSIQGSKQRIIDGMTAIIQKTYLLKISRNLHSEICFAAEKMGREDMLIDIGIESYQTFLEYFSSNKEDSDGMKKIYTVFNNNPLLRWKIFMLRKELCDGRKILSYVENHQKKITLHLARLYRMRNIITHMGRDPYGLSFAVNHLHNYFDYIVNYILCKSENDNLIKSMSILIFETQNDNRIHHELLKSDEPLSKKTYMKYFFGADEDLINYKFS